MRLSARLIVSLVVAVLVVSTASAWYDVADQQRRMRGELATRGATLAESLEQASVPLVEQHESAQLEALAERFGNRERLAGVVIADAAYKTIAATTGLSAPLRTQALGLVDPAGIATPSGTFVSGKPPMYIYARPIVKTGERIGTLAIFYDTTYISDARARLWRNVLIGILVQIAWIVPITALVVRFSLINPLKRTTNWLRSIRTGQAEPPVLPQREADLFQPLAREVSHLVNTLESVRAVAQEEARLRDAGEFLWTPERLRVHVRNRLQDRPLFVVSNREPYLHVKRNGSAEVLVPASGLVTALEPVLRACDGTWIAHGSADADRRFVDAHDRLRVPPDHPEYTLRRVWLTPEEESGYYFGFSNEGIWPLCHIAHTRPLFRASDWACYQEANRKFADAVIEEMEGLPGAIVLVQDYHLALLPRMIKKARPDARVAIFWHIPWPNPEAFGICPWQRELLDGLLGADLVGFHTQAHCNNFLETVERALESQVEWEHFTARRHDHLTHVKPFPISVASKDTPEPVDRPAPVTQRTAVIKELGSSAAFLGIGVDRIDYTKGILERFRGVERFLERWESFQGEFTFVQIGAPSRTRIKRYEDLNVEVAAEAERINKRFQTATWKPIVLRLRHHDHKEIEPFYRTADLCLVTSLHDGMNLVAKEFVMSREDSDGVLILSQFTGASRELPDALIVNPYDTEQLADAIHRGLEMDPEERHARMRRMRQYVREHNVYRWAGTFIGDLSDIRVDAPHEVPAPSSRLQVVGNGRSVA